MVGEMIDKLIESLNLALAEKQEAYDYHQSMYEIGEEEDDDWENTREYYEIIIDELSDQISCLKAFKDSMPEAKDVKVLEHLCRQKQKDLKFTNDPNTVANLEEEIAFLLKLLP